MARAPDGSATRRARSAASRTPAAISASLTVTMASRCARKWANVRSPSAWVRVPSAMVRDTSAADQRTIFPFASESRASAASSGSTPMTRMPGRRPLTAAPTPLASPPPPTGTSTIAVDGRSSTISSPTVPCPAMIRSSSKGGMMARPRSAAMASARSLRSSDAGPTTTISAPSAATRSRLTAGASSGMTTTALVPSSRAARATPWAWLPDE